MKTNRTILILIATVALLLLAGYAMFELKTVPDVKWKKNYTFSSQDPHGAMVFRDMLSTFFNSIQVEELADETTLQDITDSNQLYILIGNTINLNNDETTHLIEFIEKGNQAILIANHFTLGDLYYNYYPRQTTFFDSLLAINYTSSSDTFRFIHYYPTFHTSAISLFTALNDTGSSGDSLVTYSTDEELIFMDSLNQVSETEDSLLLPTIDTPLLEKNRAESEADYVDEDYPEPPSNGGKTSSNLSFYQSYSLKAGKLHFHSLPLVFSNMSALQPDFREHFNLVFREFTPQKVWLDHIQWHAGAPEDSESPLQFILNQKPLRWAYFLTIFTVLVYIVINSKRRQKVIPMNETNINTSLEYINTVSSLYLSQDNHIPVVKYQRDGFYHLIKKRYFIEPHQPDFTRQLIKKSQVDPQQVLDLLDELDKSKKYLSVRSSYPVVIYNKIKEFLKKAK